MNKCQSNSEGNESLAFKKRDTVSQLQKKKKEKKRTFTDHGTLPDERVIVHNNEPLGFRDRAVQKSLKDCERFPAVACK